MIYVALGTHERPFYRLVKQLEKLIASKKIKEKVVVQLGYTDYKPRGTECCKFLPDKKYRKAMKNSSIIITHSGSGTILTSLGLGKSTIIVPRRKKFDEHVNDHQLQIANTMSKEKGVIVVNDIRKLYTAITKAKSMKIARTKRKPAKMIRIIADHLGKWSNG